MLDFLNFFIFSLKLFLSTLLREGISNIKASRLISPLNHDSKNVYSKAE